MVGDYSFCPECGSPVEPRDSQEVPAQTPEAVPSSPNQHSSTVHALSKKAKIMIASGVVVVLLFVGLYFLGKYLTDDQRLIERFEQTVDGDKAGKLFDMLSASNEDIQFTQKTADGIVAYLKSNKASLEAIIEELNSEAEQLNKGDMKSFENDLDTAFIYLQKKDKKRWFIFEDYELKLKRYMVPVQTNFAGAKILVDDKEAVTTEEENSAVELGPFLPGEYEIKAIYEGEYTTLENETKISLFPMKRDNNSVEIILEGDYVNVSSNNSYAKIFINNKDINLAVGDGQRIGPIAVDGSNKIVVEVAFPWGKKRSGEQVLDSDQVELNVEGLDDKLKEDVMGVTHDFLSSWMQSFQARENQLRHVHPDRLGDYTEYFTDMVVNNESYIGTLNKMTFDLDSFKVNQYDEADYSISVKAMIDYSEVFYYKEFDPNPVPVDGTNYEEYHLVYEDGQWLVSGWSKVNDFSTANTKVYE